MIVNKFEIPEDVLEMLQGYMQVRRFRASDLEAQVKEIADQRNYPDLLSHGLAMRVADRLIQKHRKAGDIKLVYPPGRRTEWSWAKSEAAVTADKVIESLEKADQASAAALPAAPPEKAGKPRGRKARPS